MAPLHRQALASALMLLSASRCIEGFITPLSSSSTWKEQITGFGGARVTLHHPPTIGLQATKDDETSFSRKKESPLGVRRRVKAVLEKARTRTGIKNSSAQNDQDRGASLIAEAASIGGLGFENSTVANVAFEYQRRAKTNGRRDVKDPASTSSPFVRDGTVPDEVLVLSNKTNSRTLANAELDAMRADVPAAYAEPLPFTLPRLATSQKRRLVDGERIEEQSKMGREGSGYVVVDVKAPPYVVWECLLDFESYPNTIPTVRDVSFFSSENLKSGYYAEKPIDPSTGRELRHYGTPSTTRAAFVLSKFRLNIAAIHNYRPHPDGHYMVFTLDPECTNVVLKSAKGIWHTQTNPDGRGEEWTRVWLICELRISPVLPTFIVDYAARRAMPRASSWLKPQVETASKLWLSNGAFPRIRPQKRVNGETKPVPVNGAAPKGYKDGFVNGAAPINGALPVNGEVTNGAAINGEYTNGEDKKAPQ